MILKYIHVAQVSFSATLQIIHSIWSSMVVAPPYFVDNFVKLLYVEHN